MKVSVFNNTSMIRGANSTVNVTKYKTSKGAKDFVGGIKEHCLRHEVR